MLTLIGTGRGPDATRSRQVPSLVEHILKKGQILQAGAGKTEWDNVHIQDLSQLLVLLTEAAVAKNLDSELWGERGYYLAENGFHVWGELAKKIGELAYQAGYIQTTDVKIIDKDEAQKIGPFAFTWALNSKGKSLRAKKFLGWTPARETLEASLPDLIETEAVLAGIKKGHAEKVASKE